MGGVRQFIDAQGESRRLLIALDGRAKLVLLTAALVVNLTAGGLRVPLSLAMIAFLLIMAAGIRPAPFLRRMAVPFALAVIAFATQLFWFQEGIILANPSFFGHEFVLYTGGIRRGLDLAARIIGGMGVLLFFSLTTPLPELMRAARFFRFPPVVVELALIMYRYIFLLLEEGERIRAAQKARLGFVDFRRALHSSGILGGMLVLRTYDRAERSFAAMRCRGYRGMMNLVTPAPMQGRDWIALGSGLALLGILFGIR
jgi:cobalt/nickel transport system permease protein